MTAIHDAIHRCLSELGNDPVRMAWVKGMARLTIGDLAKRTGTKVETIRYYERIGLLPEPGRTEGNYRSYGSEHLGRLSFIRRARDLGFSLDQVRELLGLADQRPSHRPPRSVSRKRRS
jgi:DNA-binding transcriptional MerR regulator